MQSGVPLNAENTTDQPGNTEHDRTILGQSSSADDDTEWAELLPERYQFERVIGRGGMGTVIAVTDTSFDRTLALKTTRGDSDHTQRFLREANVSGNLQHPGIPSVVDVGEL